MPELTDMIIERLDQMESILFVIVNQERRTQTLIKEIRNTMATQADVDAITAQLDGLSAAVAKIGADLTAFAARPGLSLAALQAEVTKVGNSLQAVDDLIPEQEAPAE